ncbi:hypothetical protein [Streptomyces pseudovenezuelae]|uniref:hypothetical protein n=1 Tax=Streptomyces pseudovenezuelae TaxID=67350 RepID=UPI00371032FB
MIDGEPVLSLEIAHIRALKPNGKRYEASWSVERRNSFANLLLLCNVHHKRIDGAGGEKYTPEILESWKSAREADGQAALAGLSGLTEERLAVMIREAQEAYVERITPILGAVAQQVPEMASLMRILTADVEALRGRRPGVSEDTARMLYEASAKLGHLQDNAPLLLKASSGFRHLQDQASLLSRLAALPGKLNAAAQEVRDAAAALSDARRR